MEDFPVLIPREVKDVNSVAHPDGVEEINNGEMEKSDETPIMQQEQEENTEETEAPLSSKETNESEVEKQVESKVKKTVEPEDMNKIEEAPLENTPQKPESPKEIPIESEVNEMDMESVSNEVDNSEKSEENAGNEEIVVYAEVMHSNNSQEIRGALPSPKVTDPIDEFLLSITLDEGKKLILSDSEIFDFMVTEKSPEHTDTGIMDTASEVDDFMKSTESPSASLESRPTPGQRAGGKSSSNDIMDMEITQMIAAQN